MDTKRSGGEIRYDDQFGHVCTCTATVVRDENGDLDHPCYRPTVHVARDVAPTESGSWFYVCADCGAGAWSGC